MLTPAAPSFLETLPSVPGLSVRVTVKTSSSVVSQPIDEQIFLAAAVLSTTMRTAPRPPSVVAIRARMFTFLAPRAAPISPSRPGWSETQIVSCFARGIYPTSQQNPGAISIGSLAAKGQPWKVHGPRSRLDAPTYPPPHGGEGYLESTNEPPGPGRARKRMGAVHDARHRRGRLGRAGRPRLGSEPSD